MTKTLVKGDWYTVTTASTCTITDANGKPLGTAVAGKQFDFQAATELITFSDDDATVLANPKHAPVAAGNSSGGNAAEELRLELLGESVEDTLHWSDPEVSMAAHSNLAGYQWGSFGGFEEYVEKDGAIWALRVYKKKGFATQYDNLDGVEDYCVASFYTSSGALAGSVRGIFSARPEDVYVEFDTALAVQAGGKIKFEFGLMENGEDEGFGKSATLLAGYLANGYLVKKEGARILKGVNYVAPQPAPGFEDRTLFRTIYYKIPGVVDEKIAEHATDPEEIVTVEVFACNFLNADAGVTYASPCSAATTWAILDPTGTIQNTWSDIALITPIDYTPIWSELTFKDGEVYGYKWVVKRKHAAAVVQRWKEWKEASEAAGGNTWLITVSGAANS